MLPLYAYRCYLLPVSMHFQWDKYAAPMTLIKVVVSWVTPHGWTLGRCICMQDLRPVNLLG